ncbi:phosphate ABC transporter ATP-binding protein [Lentibacillus sp. L22]|uniref:ABC transporter ATP-binding protein n=1 Tax=Lentibacillus TaxID=175304 RepID=UPI0022B1BFE8|nr:phosphate ABC transporter ATP-binding protein [Lentibacillus daqui]
MTAEKNAAIRLNRVNYTAGDTPIIKNVTGDLTEGAITTIVGPSGAGKTTLFRLCNGLLSPSTGEIYIKDKRTSDYDPVTLRRTVGMALQSATMIPGSVRKNLALPRKLQGKDLTDEEAEKMLHTVGLDESLLSRNIKDLSGGQRQKLSVARTLVNQPDILLLDEITSSLDRVSKEAMEELIVKINREHGTTIIWISHNLEQAETIGDYSWVMMDGEVLETGESGFLHNPQNERVEDFVKGVNR